MSTTPRLDSPRRRTPSCAQIAARYPQARSGLLPMLHLVQSSRAGSRPRASRRAPRSSGISAAEVSGVATFYTMYKRSPVGDYHVGVCTNTLCAVMGGDVIFERLKDHLDVGNDETTDGRQGHPRAHRVQRGLRLRAGDDGQLGVHGQHDARVGHPAGRRPALRRRGPLHPRPAHLHLARGRAGARRLPRRPRRRGPLRRARLAGRPGHRPRARLDGAAAAGARPTPAAGDTSGEAAAEQADTSRAESETKVEESRRTKHEDDPRARASDAEMTTR